MLSSFLPCLLIFLCYLLAFTFCENHMHVLESIFQEYLIMEKQGNNILSGTKIIQENSVYGWVSIDYIATLSGLISKSYLWNRVEGNPPILLPCSKRRTVSRSRLEPLCAFMQGKRMLYACSLMICFMCRVNDQTT